jgi:hypothetical protein
VSVLASVLLGACVFDSSGVPEADRREGIVRDATAGRDTPGVEPRLDLVPEQPPADVSVDRQVDQGTGADFQVADRSNDAAMAPKPVAAAALSAALAAASVPCVDRNGVSQGGSMPIVDDSTVSFVDAALALGTARSSTQAWTGALPATTVIWDINACDLEDPTGNSADWESAGLLIRGATIDGQGALQLAPGVTLDDINFIDVDASGAFQGATDFAQPTDSDLKNYPQLVNPVTTAKGIILALSKP